MRPALLQAERAVLLRSRSTALPSAWHLAARESAGRADAARHSSAPAPLKLPYAMCKRSKRRYRPTELARPSALLTLNRSEARAGCTVRRLYSTGRTRGVHRTPLPNGCGRARLHRLPSYQHSHRSHIRPVILNGRGALALVVPSAGIDYSGSPLSIAINATTQEYRPSSI